MKKLLKNKWIWLVVIIAGIGFWRYKTNQDQAKNGSKEKVVMVKKQDVVYSLQISGEVVAEKQAVLNFPIPGELAFVGVKDGDMVRKGQILASLDLGDLQAAETRAYYAYLAADAYAKLIEDQVKNHDSDETFAQKNSRVSAQTARDSAYDAWLSAKRAVSNARLVAPLSGVVTNVTVNTNGDTVSIGDGVTVIDPNSLYFEGEVDETDIGKLSNDPEVLLTLDAFDGATFSGKLERVGYSSRVSSTGATVYPIKIKFVDVDKNKIMRMGMNGDAKIILAEKKQVLAVPLEAVIDGKVYKKNGETKLTSVEVGLEGDDFTEILSGLSEGEQVIIK